MVMFMQMPETPPPQLPADHDTVMVFNLMVPASCAFYAGDRGGNGICQACIELRLQHLHELLRRALLGNGSDGRVRLLSVRLELERRGVQRISAELRIKRRVNQLACGGSAGEGAAAQ